MRANKDYSNVICRDTFTYKLQFPHVLPNDLKPLRQEAIAAFIEVSSMLPDSSMPRRVTVKSIVTGKVPDINKNNPNLVNGCIILYEVNCNAITVDVAKEINSPDFHDDVVRKVV
eukprot:UN30302